jgi:putative ABC transport system permease protein
MVTLGMALRLIAHQKVRTAVGVSGIAFAVLFIFLQLGFSGALTATAVAVSSNLEGELVLVSTRFLHIAETGSIPRSRLFQAMAVPEVSSATPLYMRFARWKAPNSGSRCSMFAIGFPVFSPPPLRLQGLEAAVPSLAAPGTLAADRISQAQCGVDDALGVVEVRERNMTVVGRYSMGIGFLGDGSMITSDETYAQMFEGQSLDAVDMAVVRLRPGSDAAAVAARLGQVLPKDTMVLTRKRLDDLQSRYWVQDTAIGSIFALGTIVGFLVGTMILYQVLSTDIRSQLPQYATMKAMGFPNQRIYLLVLQQSWLFAALGYLPALLSALLVYKLAYDATRIPIAMDAFRAVLVLVLSLAMCTVSGLFSLRRVGNADPAELF